MTAQLERLYRQLERARFIGDHAAEVMLLTRIRAALRKP
jgi:hypothetical protein